MRRPPLRTAVLLLCALLGGAAHALDGVVVDAESGEPLAGVSLSVIGGTQTARSDSAGRFALIPDPRPPFQVLAVLPGGRYARPVTVAVLPESGSWTLAIEALLDETVTVTAGATPGIDSAPANATNVVSREDLEARETRNLTQTLENVPGVNNVSEGHAAVPAIRGLAQARSLVLIDGSRVTSERRVGPSATFMDPFILEGVELSRGPGSVAYGSDAFGGVIMARTRRPRPGADLGFTASGTLGVGIPQQRAGFEMESGLGDDAGILFSGHWRNFEDFDSPEGEVLNSGSSDRGFLTSFTKVVGDGVFEASVQYDYGSDIERPRNNSDEVRFYYPEETSLRVNTSFESGPVAGFDATKLSLFVGDHGIVTDQDRRPTATTDRQIERADVSANDFGVRASADRAWGQTQFHFGIDYNGRVNLEAEDVTIDFDSAGTQTAVTTFPTIEDAERIDIGVYASAEGKLSDVVSLAGGLRFDRIRSSNRGGFFGDLSVSNSEPSGNVGLTFGNFGGFSATVQFARGFRDARISDRFFRGVTGAGFITGNPDLEPETSRQYDVALRYGKGRWNGAVYLYHYRIDDLIERFEDPMQEDFFFFRNRGRARIRGVELELSGTLPHEVSLVIASSVSEGEALDDGGDLDDISPENLVVQARKTFGRKGWVQARALFANELDEPGPGEIPLDSRVVVDASAGWHLTERFELRLLVRNLFDEAYLLTADDRAPLAPGVSAAISGRLRF